MITKERRREINVVRGDELFAAREEFPGFFTRRDVFGNDQNGNAFFFANVVYSDEQGVFLLKNSTGLNLLKNSCSTNCDQKHRQIAHDSINLISRHQFPLHRLLFVRAPQSEEQMQICMLRLLFLSLSAISLGTLNLFFPAGLLHGVDAAPLVGDGLSASSNVPPQGIHIIDLKGVSGKRFSGERLRKSTVPLSFANLKRSELAKFSEHRQKCKKWIVVTSIFPPSKAVRVLGEMTSRGWCFVVVGDVNGPSDYDDVEGVVGFILPWKARLVYFRAYVCHPQQGSRPGYV